MTNYRKSDYALNKVSKGIVYQNADGSIVEITFEKIAAEDPTFTKEDFENLKKFSDEIYKEESNFEAMEAYHVKSYLDEKIDSDWLATNNLEDEIFEETEKKKEKEKSRLIKQLQKAIDTQLTETQKRRLYMNVFRGMTYREIAKLEGAHFTSVCENIRTAKKKIKKYLIIF